MLYDVIVVFNLGLSMVTFESGEVGKIFSFFVFLKLKSGIQIVYKIEEKLNLTGTKKYYWSIIQLLCKVKYPQQKNNKNLTNKKKFKIIFFFNLF
jgi:hypothetical protein